MADFDLFDKPLREVGMDDLSRLSDRNISEGLYVEFKRTLPETQDVTKVISSFANTHGGYYIIGIAEEDTTNIASGRIGVNTDDHPDPKETIRHAVRDRLDPSPFFTTRAILREDYEDYAILIVEVPESERAPHIHSSGVIYTRTGEGSDPVTAITDRWEVDQLYDRRDQRQERIDEFCQLDLGLTQGQAGSTDQPLGGPPFLELYGVPSTIGKPVGGHIGDDIDEFRSIIENSEIVMARDRAGEDDSEPDWVEFSRPNFAYRTGSDALIAQSWSTGRGGGINTAHTPQTVKFFNDGAFKAFLSLPEIPELDRNIEAQEAFFRAIDGNTRNLRFVDGAELLLRVSTWLLQYKELLDHRGWTDGPSKELWVQSRTRNSYRTAVVFEEDWFKDLVDEYGPPVVYEDGIEAWMNIGRLIWSEDDLTFITMAVAVCGILDGFGIPPQEQPDAIGELYSEMAVRSGP